MSYTISDFDRVSSLATTYLPLKWKCYGRTRDVCATAVDARADSFRNRPRNTSCRNCVRRKKRKTPSKIFAYECYYYRFLRVSRAPVHVVIIVFPCRVPAFAVHFADTPPGSRVSSPHPIRVFGSSSRVAGMRNRNAAVLSPPRCGSVG